MLYATLLNRLYNQPSFPEACEVGALHHNGNQPALLRFGPYELNTENGELRKQGRPIRLQPQPCKVLAALASQPGKLVTRQEIREHVWDSSTFVDFEQGLNFCIRQIRLVLDDNAEAPHFIETVPRRGYRFIAHVDIQKLACNSEVVSHAEQSLLQQQISTASSSWIPRSTLRNAVLIGTALALLALGLTFAVLTKQRSESLKVGQYTRITNDGRDKTGNLSDGIPSPILTDGTRLYFVEPKTEAGVSGLVQVSTAGGDTLRIPTPFQNVRLTDISPDRTHLLVGDVVGATSVDVPFYSLPTVGGSALRLGNFVAHDASWAPNATNLAYATGDSLYIAKADGTDPRKVVSGLGAVWWPRWSPDSSRLRFTVTDPKTQDNSIWEVAVDGTSLRALSPGWNLAGNACCGSWMPNGNYFVFQSSQGDMTNIWAVSERHQWFTLTRPQQVSSGPVLAFGAASSMDGKKIFAVGLQPRVEPIRYARQNKQFVSLFPGLSAESVDFTRDGKWITYIAYPEGTLWRAQRDGSQRVQLTSVPLRAFRPRWSPDGTRIIFFGSYPHRPWKVYLLSPNEGTPEQVVSGDENEADPTWSSDSRRIVYGRVPWMPSAPEKPLLYVLDLTSKQAAVLPGSDGLFSPRWSPSGRYIAALSADSSKLMLCDLETGKWRLLAQGMLGSPEWSHNETYVYAANIQAAVIVRIRVSDGKIEPVANLNAERIAFVSLAPWTGLAPDDSVLTVRDLSSQEIYALELKSP
jgi:Tol biopolymer transport system component/DNA-binding winged helix-turn-helix (wHTH) protein